MQSHDDKDSPALRELMEKAQKLTERGENRITAGAPGEKPLQEWSHSGIFVRKLPDDPLALRVSLGEARAIGERAYCVFRGTRTETIRLLEGALIALRAGPSNEEALP